MKSYVDLVYEHPNKYKEIFRISKKELGILSENAEERSYMSLENTVRKSVSTDIIMLNIKKYMEINREIKRQKLDVLNKNIDGIICVTYPIAKNKIGRAKNEDQTESYETTDSSYALQFFLNEDKGQNPDDVKESIDLLIDETEQRFGFDNIEDAVEDLDSVIKEN